MSKLVSLHHIWIGLCYIGIGIIGGSLGLGFSLLIRLELSLPGFVLSSSMQYNSSITFHGILMIFFMIMPILMGGFGNVLLPLMLSCSDMIYPRLNALSLWSLFMSFWLALLGVFVDGGVNAGWTFYVPLSIMNSSSIDAFFFSLHLAGVSSILGSINFVGTILGNVSSDTFSVSHGSLSFSSSFPSCSLFPWSIFFTSLLLLISLPVLAACITMIIYDRHFNSSFYDPFRGGDVILFQHLFWFFGHPEVYILILPGFGLISEIISKYVQSFIFGRDSMLLALLIIGLLGCLVWGHHMFIVGFDIDTRVYFSTATTIIAIPTGIKIFNWMNTLYASSVYLITPIFFVIGFLFSFSFGGVTGLILANSFIDTILHDSYFVVGHFHYVLSLGAVYSVFASFYAYFALFDILIIELIGRLTFITFFISSNLIFFNMHSLGLLGLPRRIFDYRISYLRYNWSSSFGIIGVLLTMLLFTSSLSV